jgi:hypothetical protein
MPPDTVETPGHASLHEASLHEAGLREVTLREVNASLRSALLRLRPERRHCSSLQPQDFSDIRNQLSRAAKCWQLQPPDSETAAATSAVLEKERLEYRNHLEKLKQFLPDLRLRLLAEKSRLESARAQVVAAATWARARKTTL